MIFSMSFSSVLFAYARLKDICNQRKILLLVNTNITSTHLNSKGLHLNRQGSATLQRNFKDFANDFFN